MGLPGGPGLWLGGAALVIALLALVIALTSGGGSEPKAGATGPVGATFTPLPTSSSGGVDGSASPEPEISDSTDPNATAVPTGPVAAPVDCGSPTVTVSTADALTNALAQAKPGMSIEMEDGVYSGAFVANVKGTAAQPITLCGGSGAIIDGGGIKKGYGFHLDSADYWNLSGFTVRDAQKGVVADDTQHAVISHLTVYQIGDEGIHLRKFSSDNVVEDNVVHDTGQRRDKFGEGIYVGSANSNWGQITGGKPDNSDRNMIRGNTITATTAEEIDIKEGTTGGTVTGNTFDGSKLTGADSWVDVKGNGWTISDNTGNHSPLDGFQTHQVYAGWGTNNTFSGNTANVDGSGYGFHFAPVENNKLTCNNKVTAAGQGLANVSCIS